jgi:hypothetical protein
MNMKKLNVGLAIFVVAVMAGNAQTNSTNTVYSDIVGYHTKTISSGLNSVGLPLLKSDLVKTTATSVTANSILLSGETNFGAKLNSAKSYYVEVYSGTLKGDRFDVDVTGSIAAANGGVVLNPSSGNNTMPVASIGTNLNSQTIAVREHISIADLEAMLSAPATGTASVATSDSIGFTEAGALVFYTKKIDGSWKRVGSPSDFSTKIIPPGSGVFFRKAGSGSSILTQVGNVRDNDFARVYTNLLDLTAPAYPIDKTPSSLGVVPGAGSTDWTGGTAATGDSVSIIEGGALVKYTLKSDGKLTRVGSPSDFINNTAVFAGSEAQLIKRSKANADTVMVKPY